MTNKLYRIFDTKEQKYLSIGYKPKSTWLVFPSEAIKYNKHRFKEKNRYVVEECEMVVRRILTLDREALANAR